MPLGTKHNSILKNLSLTDGTEYHAWLRCENNAGLVNYSGPVYYTPEAIPFSASPCYSGEFKQDINIYPQGASIFVSFDSFHHGLDDSIQYFWSAGSDRGGTDILPWMYLDVLTFGFSWYTYNVGLPQAKWIYSNIKAVNSVGKVVQRSTDGFMFSNNAPEITHLVLRSNGIQHIGSLPIACSWNGTDPVGITRIDVQLGSSPGMGDYSPWTQVTSEDIVLQTHVFDLQPLDSVVLFPSIRVRNYGGFEATFVGFHGATFDITPPSVSSGLFKIAFLPVNKYTDKSSIDFTFDLGLHNGNSDLRLLDSGFLLEIHLPGFRDDETGMQYLDMCLIPNQYENQGVSVEALAQIPSRLCTGKMSPDKRLLIFSIEQVSFSHLVLSLIAVNKIGLITVVHSPSLYIDKKSTICENVEINLSFYLKEGNQSCPSQGTKSVLYLIASWSPCTESKSASSPTQYETSVIYGRSSSVLSDSFDISEAGTSFVTEIGPIHLLPGESAVFLLRATSVNESTLLVGEKTSAPLIYDCSPPEVGPITLDLLPKGQTRGFHHLYSMHLLAVWPEPMDNETGIQSCVWALCDHYSSISMEPDICLQNAFEIPVSSMEIQISLPSLIPGNVYHFILQCVNFANMITLIKSADFIAADLPSVGPLTHGPYCQSNYIAHDLDTVSICFLKMSSGYGQLTRISWCVGSSRGLDDLLPCQDVEINLRSITAVISAPTLESITAIDSYFVSVTVFTDAGLNHSIVSSGIRIDWSDPEAGHIQIGEGKNLAVQGNHSAFTAASHSWNASSATMISTQRCTAFLWSEFTDNHQIHFYDFSILHDSNHTPIYELRLGILTWHKICHRQLVDDVMFTAVVTAYDYSGRHTSSTQNFLIDSSYPQIRDLQLNQIFVSDTGKILVSFIIEESHLKALYWRVCPVQTQDDTCNSIYISIAPDSRTIVLDANNWQLDQGKSYRVSIQAVDEIGHKSESSSQSTFIFDDSAPKGGSIRIVANGISGFHNARFSIHVCIDSQFSDPESGLKGTQVCLGSQPGMSYLFPCTDIELIDPFTANILHKQPICLSLNNLNLSLASKIVAVLIGQNHANISSEALSDVVIVDYTPPHIGNMSVMCNATSDNQILYSNLLTELVTSRELDTFTVVWTIPQDEESSIYSCQMSIVNSVPSDRSRTLWTDVDCFAGKISFATSVVSNNLMPGVVSRVMLSIVNRALLESIILSNDFIWDIRAPALGRILVDSIPGGFGFHWNGFNDETQVRYAFGLISMDEQVQKELVPVGSATNHSLNKTNLAEGIFKAMVCATDAALNSICALSERFVVERTAPLPFNIQILKIRAVVASDSQITSWTVSFSWECIVLSHLHILHFQFCAGYMAGTDNLLPCVKSQNNKEATVTLVVDSPSMAQKIFITVIAEAIGGSRKNSSSEPFMLDSTPPDIGTITMIPVNDACESSCPTLPFEGNQNQSRYVVQSSLSTMKGVLVGIRDLESGILSIKWRIVDSEGAAVSPWSISFQDGQIGIFGLNLKDAFSYQFEVVVENLHGLKTRMMSSALTIERSNPPSLTVFDGGTEALDVDWSNELSSMSCSWSIETGIDANAKPDISYFEVGLKEMNRSRASRCGEIDPWWRISETTLLVRARIYPPTAKSAHFSALGLQHGVEYLCSVHACAENGRCSFAESDGFIVDLGKPRIGCVRPRLSTNHSETGPLYVSDGLSLDMQWTSSLTMSNIEQASSHCELDAQETQPHPVAALSPIRSFAVYFSTDQKVETNLAQINSSSTVRITLQNLENIRDINSTCCSGQELLSQSDVAFELPADLMTSSLLAIGEKYICLSGSSRLLLLDIGENIKRTIYAENNFSPTCIGTDKHLVFVSKNFIHLYHFGKGTFDYQSKITVSDIETACYKFVYSNLLVLYEPKISLLSGFVYDPMSNSWMIWRSTTFLTITTKKCSINLLSYSSFILSITDSDSQDIFELQDTGIVHIQNVNLDIGALSIGPIVSNHDILAAGIPDDNTQSGSVVFYTISGTQLDLTCRIGGAANEEFGSVLATMKRSSGNVFLAGGVDGNLWVIASGECNRKAIFSSQAGTQQHLAVISSIAAVGNVIISMSIENPGVLYAVTFCAPNQSKVLLSGHITYSCMDAIPGEMCSANALGRCEFCRNVQCQQDNISFQYIVPLNLTRNLIYWPVVFATSQSNNQGLGISRPIVFDDSKPTNGYVFEIVREGSSSSIQKSISLQDDVDYISYGNGTLSAFWDNFFDPESGIESFAVGVGTQGGLADIISFSNIGLSKSVEFSFLPWLHGRSFYVTVIACNRAVPPMCSNATSDGVTLDQTPPILLYVKDGFQQGVDWNSQEINDAVFGNALAYEDVGEISDYEWVFIEQSNQQTLSSSSAVENDTAAFEYQSSGSSSVFGKVGSSVSGTGVFYVCVRALNFAGLRSNSICSNGVRRGQLEVAFDNNLDNSFVFGLIKVQSASSISDQSKAVMYVGLDVPPMSLDSNLSIQAGTLDKSDYDGVALESPQAANISTPPNVMISNYSFTLSVKSSQTDGPKLGDGYSFRRPIMFTFAMSVSAITNIQKSADDDANVSVLMLRNISTGSWTNAASTCDQSLLNVWNITSRFSYSRLTQIFTVYICHLTQFAIGVQQLPIAVAGTDILLQLPDSFCVLNGSLSFDDNGGTIESYQWTVVDTFMAEKAMDTAIILFPNSAVAQLSGCKYPAVYTIQLNVMDNDFAESADTIRIYVIGSNATLLLSWDPEVFILPYEIYSFSSQPSILITAVNSSYMMQRFSFGQVIATLEVSGQKNGSFDSTILKGNTSAIIVNGSATFTDLKVSNVSRPFRLLFSGNLLFVPARSRLFANPKNKSSSSSFAELKMTTNLDVTTSNFVDSTGTEISGMLTVPELTLTGKYTNTLPNGSNPVNEETRTVQDIHADTTASQATDSTLYTRTSTGQDSSTSESKETSMIQDTEASPSAGISEKKGESTSQAPDLTAEVEKSTGRGADSAITAGPNTGRAADSSAIVQTSTTQAVNATADGGSSTSQIADAEVNAASRTSVTSLGAATSVELTVGTSTSQGLEAAVSDGPSSSQSAGVAVTKEASAGQGTDSAVKAETSTIQAAGVSGDEGTSASHSAFSSATTYTRVSPAANSTLVTDTSISQAADISESEATRSTQTSDIFVNAGSSSIQTDKVSVTVSSSTNQAADSESHTEATSTSPNASVSDTAGTGRYQGTDSAGTADTSAGQSADSGVNAGLSTSQAAASSVTSADTSTSQAADVSETGGISSTAQGTDVACTADTSAGQSADPGVNAGLSTSQAAASSVTSADRSTSRAAHVSETAGASTAQGTDVASTADTSAGQSADPGVNVGLSTSQAASSVTSADTSTSQATDVSETGGISSTAQGTDVARTADTSAGQSADSGVNAGLSTSQAAASSVTSADRSTSQAADISETVGTSTAQGTDAAGTADTSAGQSADLGVNVSLSTSQAAASSVTSADRSTSQAADVSETGGISSKAQGTDVAGTADTSAGQSADSGVNAGLSTSQAAASSVTSADRSTSRAAEVSDIAVTRMVQVIVPENGGLSTSKRSEGTFFSATTFSQVADFVVTTAILKSRVADPTGALGFESSHDLDAGSISGTSTSQDIDATVDAVTNLTADAAGNSSNLRANATGNTETSTSQGSDATMNVGTFTSSSGNTSVRVGADLDEVSTTQDGAETMVTSTGHIVLDLSGTTLKYTSQDSDDTTNAGINSSQVGDSAVNEGTSMILDTDTATDAGTTRNLSQGVADARYFTTSQNGYATMSTSGARLGADSALTAAVTNNPQDAGSAVNTRKSTSKSVDAAVIAQVSTSEGGNPALNTSQIVVVTANATISFSSSADAIMDAGTSSVQGFSPGASFRNTRQEAHAAETGRLGTSTSQDVGATVNAGESINQVIYAADTAGVNTSHVSAGSTSNGLISSSSAAYSETKTSQDSDIAVSESTRTSLYADAAADAGARTSPIAGINTVTSAAGVDAIVSEGANTSKGIDFDVIARTSASLFHATVNMEKRTSAQGVTAVNAGVSASQGSDAHIIPQTSNHGAVDMKVNEGNNTTVNMGTSARQGAYAAVNNSTSTDANFAVFSKTDAAVNTGLSTNQSIIYTAKFAVTGTSQDAGEGLHRDSQNTSAIITAATEGISTSKVDASVKADMNAAQAVNATRNEAASFRIDTDSVTDTSTSTIYSADATTNVITTSQYADATVKAGTSTSHDVDAAANLGNTGAGGDAVIHTGTSTSQGADAAVNAVTANQDYQKTEISAGSVQDQGPIIISFSIVMPYKESEFAGAVLETFVKAIAETASVSKDKISIRISKNLRRAENQIFVEVAIACAGQQQAEMISLLATESAINNHLSQSGLREGLLLKPFSFSNNTAWTLSDPVASHDPGSKVNNSSLFSIVIPIFICSAVIFWLLYRRYTRKNTVLNYGEANIAAELFFKNNDGLPSTVLPLAKSPKEFEAFLMPKCDEVTCDLVFLGYGLQTHDDVQESVRRLSTDSERTNPLPEITSEITTLGSDQDLSPSTVKCLFEPMESSNRLAENQSISFQAARAIFAANSLHLGSSSSRRLSLMDFADVQASDEGRSRQHRLFSSPASLTFDQDSGSCTV